MEAVPRAHRPGGLPPGALALLVVSAALSGAASLVAQVVWVRRLGELFGSGPVSVAVVLSLFFAGLGVGARWGGVAADRRRGPIGLVLGLELASAAAALLFLPAAGGIERLWLWIARADDAPAGALAIKAGLAAALLLPPSIAMGAQLPALVRHLLRQPAALGRRVALLYGANTLGAALGVGAAGFVLLPLAGPGVAMLAAAALHLGAAAAAYRGRVPLALREPLGHAAEVVQPLQLEAQLVKRRTPRAGDRGPRRLVAGRGLLLVAAALSGLVSLGLEVVWTRALAARLSGTVYSYSAVLAAFLVALALGALVATRLGARGSLHRPARGLAALGAAWLGLGAGALLSGALLVHLPRLGSGALATHGSSLFVAQAREFALALAVMAPALLFAGLQLPLLVALVGRGAAGAARAGRSVGMVFAINSAAAALAPALVGLGLIPALGLTGTLALLGWGSAGFGVALVVIALLALRRSRVAVMAWTWPALLVAGGAQLALGNVPLAWRARPGADLVAYRDGLSAGVAVVDEPGGNRVLELDGDYRLGDLGTRFAQARQGFLPRLVAPDFDGSRQAALHIGLGTGTSAAALLDAGAERLLVAEIVPDLAWTLPYFAAANGDLLARFRAGEAQLVARDARELVRLSPGRFGLVVADLFVPWRAGEGAMYTLEHFRAVARCLEPGGRFVQWLPVYQLELEDLATIVATFVEAFPGAGAMWLYFNAAQPAVALVGGHEAVSAPDIGAVRERLEGLANFGPGLPLRGLLERADPALEVAGSWIADGDALARWAAGAPLERRARPRIEFRAPRALLRDPGVRTSRTLRALIELAEGAALEDPLPVRRARRLATARLLAALDAAQRGAAEGALVLAEEALALDGDFGQAGWVLEELGAAAIAAGDHAGGRRAAERLLAGSARPAGGHALAGLLARALGDAAGARAEAERALALDAQHPRALEILRRER